jgi:hypothetical protein
LETSARNGSNVEEAYMLLGKMILDDYKKSKLAKKYSDIKLLALPEVKKEKSGCC